MANEFSSARDVTLPAEFLVELQADAAVRERVAERFGRRLAERILHAEDPPRTVSVFWTRLSDLLVSLGWGSVAHRRAHPGLGLVTSDDWAEAHAGDRAGCPFAVGILHGALATVAGGRKVSVAEVGCRANGAERCTFAFGSPRAVERVRDGLGQGRSLDDAIEALPR